MFKRHTKPQPVLCGKPSDQPITVEELYEIAARAEEAHRKSSKTRALMEKLQPLISTITQYSKAFDVLVNTSSTVLSPLWGCLRILLATAVAYYEYFEKLVRMLQQIADALPRYTVYATLFRSGHEGVRNALDQGYSAFRCFLSETIAVFNSKRVVWKNAEAKFEQALENIRYSNQKIEREVEAAHFVETQRHHEEEAKARRGEQKRRLRKWLNARLCYEELEMINNSRSEGSCDWILMRDELKEWTSGSQTEARRILWINGIPGCGKSFIYANILEYLKRMKHTLFFFLFCDADGERNTFSGVARAWTRQAVDCAERLGIDVLKLVPETIHISEDRRGTTAEVLEFLTHVLSLEELPSTFLTVDALDECSDRACFFERLLPRIPKRHKLLFLSRDDVDIRRSLEKWAPQRTEITITPDDTRSDIEGYICHQLQESNLFSSHQDLKTRIFTKLRCCDGMFLWVALMLKNLEGKAFVSQVITALEKLPPNLTTTYNQITSKIDQLENSDPEQWATTQKLLFWVTVVKRPATVRELQTFLHIKIGGSELSDDQLLGDFRIIIKRLCAPFLEVRKGDVVMPIHFTVTEFLRSYMNENRIVQRLTAPYEQWQFETSDQLAAAACLSYLSLSNYGQLRVPKSHEQACETMADTLGSFDTGLLDYASRYWYLHCWPSGYSDDIQDSSKAALETLVWRLMDVSKPNMEVWWRYFWFCSPASQDSLVCPSGFTPLHIGAYLGLNYGFLKRALGTDSSATIDPKSQSGRTPLWWAAHMGRRNAVRDLFDLGADPAILDQYLVAPIHRAAASTDSSIVEPFVAQYNFDVGCITLADGEGRTPLHYAAMYGATETITLLSSSIAEGLGYPGTASRDHTGRTPLHLAALFGRADICRTLIEVDMLQIRGQIDAKDHNSDTPLHLAAENGHMAVATVLLEYNPNLTLRNKQGKRAIDRASTMGFLDVAGLLDGSKVHAPNTISRDDYSSQTVRQLPHGEENQSQISSLDRFRIDSFEACLAGGSKSFLRYKLGEKRSHMLRFHVDSRGRSTLMAAVLSRHYDTLEMLLFNFRWSAKYMNMQDKHGWTALHYAVACGERAAVEILLRCQTEPSTLMPDRNGLLPFDIAVREGHADIVDVLGIPPGRSPEKLGRNELHTRALKNDVQYLSITSPDDLKKLHSSDVFGRNPTQLALKRDHMEFAEIVALRTNITVDEVLGMSVGWEHNDEFRERVLQLASKVLRRDLGGQEDENGEEQYPRNGLHSSFSDAGEQLSHIEEGKPAQDLGM